MSTPPMTPPTVPPAIAPTLLLEEEEEECGGNGARVLHGLRVDSTVDGDPDVNADVDVDVGVGVGVTDPGKVDSAPSGQIKNLINCATSH